jgi:hypothetical protein
VVEDGQHIGYWYCGSDQVDDGADDLPRCQIAGTIVVSPNDEEPGVAASHEA